MSQCSCYICSNFILVEIFNRPWIVFSHSVAYDADNLFWPRVRFFIRKFVQKLLVSVRAGEKEPGNVWVSGAIEREMRYIYILMTRHAYIMCEVIAMIIKRNTHTTPCKCIVYYQPMDRLVCVTNAQQHKSNKIIKYIMKSNKRNPLQYTKLNCNHASLISNKFQQCVSMC
jgi:hypothetical protein